MIRQRRTVGAVIEIPIKGEYYVYAQMLEHGADVFFDYKSIVPLKDFSVLKKAPVLFVIAVYADVISKGIWHKVGKMAIRDDLRIIPLHYIYDVIGKRYELYDPNTGAITPTTKGAVQGLEITAVWDSNHVEDRIKAHYDGVPDIWTESMKWAEKSYTGK